MFSTTFTLFVFHACFKNSADTCLLLQISRNKGLTAKKKKELRNPRVKHRRKFYKAQIKRKSQVWYYNIALVFSV